MEDNKKICKCGNEKCLGFILLHEKELSELEKTKDSIRKEHGSVSFDLKRSPSSGELFTRFYDLHVIKS